MAGRYDEESIKEGHEKTGPFCDVASCETTRRLMGHQALHSSCQPSFFGALRYLDWLRCRYVPHCLLLLAYDRLEGFSGCAAVSTERRFPKSHIQSKTCDFSWLFLTSALRSTISRGEGTIFPRNGTAVSSMPLISIHLN